MAPDLAQMRLRMRQPFIADSDGKGGYGQTPLMLEVSSDQGTTWRLIPSLGISLTHEKKASTLIVRIPASMGLVEFPDLPSEYINAEED